MVVDDFLRRTKPELVSEFEYVSRLGAGASIHEVGWVMAIVRTG